MMWLAKYLYKLFFYGTIIEYYVISVKQKIKKLKNKLKRLVLAKLGLFSALAIAGIYSKHLTCLTFHNS